MAAEPCFAYMLLIDSSVRDTTLFRGDHTPIAFEKIQQILTIMSPITIDQICANGQQSNFVLDM